jgi:hypothetical protein
MTLRDKYDLLTREYIDWQTVHGLRLGSADEHHHDESLTSAQREWLKEFSRRWEAVRELSD